MHSIVNFVSLNINALLFSYTYILSVRPVTRAEKFGEKAWKDCFTLRIMAVIFESLIITNQLLWIWFPLPFVNWPVNENLIVRIIIGIAVGVPLTPFLLKGMKYAGRETMRPSKDAKMFTGIYQHIRHPQILGEMPWFIAIAFFVNSIFLVLWATLFVFLFTPVIIYFEEKDLMKRFGDKYIEYRRNTGALIPRFWKKGRLKHTSER